MKEWNDVLGKNLTKSWFGDSGWENFLALPSRLGSNWTALYSRASCGVACSCPLNDTRWIPRALRENASGTKICTCKYVFSNPRPNTKWETSGNHIIKFRRKRCCCVLPISHYVAEIRSVSAEQLKITPIRAHEMPMHTSMEGSWRGCEACLGFSDPCGLQCWWLQGLFKILIANGDLQSIFKV